MPRVPVPCAVCATPMWRGPGSLSAGESTCRNCRTAARPQHGTAKAYTRGCRCDECTAAKTQEHRAYRERRKAKGRPIYGDPQPGECTRCGKKMKHTRSPEPICRPCRGHRTGPGSHIKVTKVERLAIYERDAWTCQICSEPVDRTQRPGTRWAASLDHIIPVSLGGPDELDNLRLAHHRCNSVRGNRMEAA
jgi:hypothetical protein